MIERMTKSYRVRLLCFGLWLSAGCAEDDVWIGGRVAGFDAGARLDGSIVRSPFDAGPATLPRPVAPAAPPKPLPGPLPGSCEVPPEVALPVTGSAHINGPLVYPDEPPVGGDHNPCWARWGVYEQELTTERWVHNLEHGGVVFLFRCDGDCPGEVAAMAKIVNANPQAILSPYAGLPTRFAVVAWGVRLTTDCFDKARFQRFYDEHVGHGLEQVASNPPSSCG